MRGAGIEPGTSANRCDAVNWQVAVPGELLLLWLGTPIRLQSFTPLFELRVQMPEGGELPGEFRIAGSLHLAARREIAAAEKIGGRDDCRTHGAILIGTLRPRKIAV